MAVRFIIIINFIYSGNVRDSGNIWAIFWKVLCRHLTGNSMLHRYENNITIMDGDVL